MTPSPDETSAGEEHKQQLLDSRDQAEKESSLVVPSSPYFTLKDGPKGRGLFATSNDIALGALLHVAPTIIVSADEYERHMKHTILEHYLFKNKRSGNMLLALGYGSLFNHSKHPNVDYQIDLDGSCIRYYASIYRKIVKGDELCISYGLDLWFDDASDGESVASSESEDAVGFLTRIHCHLGDKDDEGNDDESDEKPA